MRPLNYYCDYASKYKFKSKQITKTQNLIVMLKQMNLSEISTLIEKEMSPFKLKCSI